MMSDFERLAGRERRMMRDMERFLKEQERTGRNSVAGRER
jgi:hypothetical protein